MSIHNKKKLKIFSIVISVVLIGIILMPFLPYKHPIFVLSSGYEKLKIQYCSEYGLLLREKCNELGLEENMEVGDRLIGFDKINDEIISVKYGVPRVKFNLYGNFIEDADGKTMFQIEKWSSPNVTLLESYIWDEKIVSIYKIIVFPSIILLISCIFGLLVLSIKKV